MLIRSFWRTQSQYEDVVKAAKGTILAVKELSFRNQKPMYCVHARSKPVLDIALPTPLSAKASLWGRRGTS